MSRRIAVVTVLAVLGLALVVLTFIPPRATAQMDSTSGLVVDQTYDAVWGNVSPGDRIETTYLALNGNRVAREIQLPAPEVSVQEKWVTGGGYAHPGGVAVYGIEYHNDGNGVATDALLVDTLPLSTTYAGDTSGLTPEIGAEGVITWHLGNLAPGSYAFMVTLNVSDSVPTGNAVIPANCVKISTSAPGDTNPGNDNACSNPLDVWESDVGVSVDKWPNPGDPTPGQEFEYDIQLCSERGAAYGPVWLTDTLPLSTTLLYWSSPFGKSE